jgi:hypothetical protein
MKQSAKTRRPGSTPADVQSHNQAPHAQTRTELGDQLFLGSSFGPVLLAILTGLGVLALVVSIVARFYHPDLEVRVKDLNEIGSALAISNSAPEPVEYRQYVLCLLIAPPVMLACLAAFRRVLSKIRVPSHFRLLTVVCGLGATLILIPVFFYSALEKCEFLYVRSAVYFTAPVLYAFLWFPIACGFVLLSRKRPVLWIAKGLLYVLGAYSLVLVFLTVLFDCDSIALWPTHLNAVIYPVTQVVMGKTLLVDCVALYGFYPHLIEPLFRLVGLNIFSFTIFNGLLLVGCWVCLFVFMRALVKNDFLLMAGFISAIFYSYLGGKLVANGGVRPDPYFQYAPIRMVFPCLMLMISSFYLRGKGKRWAYLGGFLAASIGLLWNPETGMVVLGGWLLLLGYTELFRRPVASAVRPIMVHGLFGLASMVVAFGGYSLFVFLRCRAWPDWSMILKYYKLISYNGYSMMPMPGIPHVWAILVVVLIAGLAVSFNGLLTRKNELLCSTVFLLSILGSGLFSYYQGRSHDFNIIPLLYIPIVLVTLIADHILTGVQGGDRRYYKYAPYAVLVFFFFASGPPSLLYQSGKFLEWARQGAGSRRAGSNGLLSKNMEFVKSHVHRGERVFFLIGGYVEGIFYAETETRSAVDVGSSVDWLFKSDLNQVVKFLEDNKQAKVFAIPGQYADLQDLFAKRYSIAAQEPQTGLAVFVPNPH